MNVAMLLEMAADAMGDRVAIGSQASGLTFEGLRRAARTVADRVEDSGARHLALIEPNGPIVSAALFGAAWAGVSYAPLNYRLPDASLQELIARIEPSIVAATNWVDPKSDSARPFPDAPEVPAVLLFTSGTSAAPKAAVLEHDQLLAYVFNTVEFMSAGEDEASLLSSPPFHIAGVTALLSSTYSGRRIVPLPGVRFSAEEWLDTARRESVTHAFLVPTMLARIVHLMEADADLRVPSLRNLVYGGARMPAPVLERALALFPDTDFVNAYGLTETSSTVALLGPDDHRLAMYSDDPVWTARLSSVGQPIPGIEVRIVDESGVDVGADVPGEIQIRGEQVSGEYADTESKTDAEGWLHTGDRGWLDVDGYLFCEGRADDTIIRGGENIGPAEIEDALLMHDAVSSACVVGLPDEEWGERVVAAITLRPGVDEVDTEHVREWVRERVGSLKTPEEIDVREELPQTATGKILRRQVKSDFLDDT
jgi:acyl-CoA synthetase (AMP-forming)/AMP-acid ligase II